jgi:hypothetical protein
VDEEGNVVVKKKKKKTKKLSKINEESSLS